MLLSCLGRPISMVSLEDIGIDKDAFLKRTAAFYSLFDWDKYLFRQNQIEFVKKHSGSNVSDKEVKNAVDYMVKAVK